MATAVLAEPIATKRYVPRGRNDLHTTFKQHFNDFCGQYDEYGYTFVVYLSCVPGIFVLFAALYRFTFSGVDLLALGVAIFIALRVGGRMLYHR